MTNRTSGSLAPDARQHLIGEPLHALDVRPVVHDTGEYQCRRATTGDGAMRGEKYSRSTPFDSGVQVIDGRAGRHVLALLLAHQQQMIEFRRDARSYFGQTPGFVRYIQLFGT